MLQSRNWTYLLSHKICIICYFISHFRPWFLMLGILFFCEVMTSPTLMSFLLTLYDLTAACINIYQHKGNINHLQHQYLQEKSQWLSLGHHPRITLCYETSVLRVADQLFFLLYVPHTGVQLFPSTNCNIS